MRLRRRSKKRWPWKVQLSWPFRWINGKTTACWKFFARMCSTNFAMASLSKIIDVHSLPILAFGEGAPVGEGRKQPDWSVESALSYMEENDISAGVLSAPAS